MRPVGALVFGYLGDTYGRKIALTSSILLMAFSTLLIGLLPTYTHIGLFAPVLLIACRLCQGLSTGGEYNGAAVFLIEQVGANKPGLIGGLITASCVVGALLGTWVGKVCSALSWVNAWRIPFILSGLVGLVLFGLRYYLVETMPTESRTQSFIAFLKENPLKFIINIGVGGLNGALSYVLFGFSLLYLTRYKGIALADAFQLNLIGLCIFMIGSPFFGHLYDKLGSSQYFLFALISTLGGIFPVNYLLLSQNQLIIGIGMILLGALTAAIAGPCHAFLQHEVPVSVRYRFVAVSFSIGMALFGGLTPTLLTAVLETYHMMLVPAVWIAILAFLLLGCVLLKMSKPQFV